MCGLFLIDFCATTLIKTLGNIHTSDGELAFAGLEVKFECTLLISSYTMTLGVLDGSILTSDGNTALAGLYKKFRCLLVALSHTISRIVLQSSVQAGRGISFFTGLVRCLVRLSCLSRQDTSSKRNKNC